MSGFVYIMANKRYGTIYTGVTSDLPRRAWDHRTGAVPGFTQRYQLHHLVYYEIHDRIETAIQREHNIKHWSRAWKIRTIVAMNPDWNDLYDEITK